MGLVGGKGCDQNIFVIENISITESRRRMRSNYFEERQRVAAMREDESSDWEYSRENYTEEELWNRKMELFERVQQARHHLTSLRPLRDLLAERYEAFSLMIWKEDWAPGTLSHMKGLRTKIDQKISAEEGVQFVLSAELREIDGLEEESDGSEEDQSLPFDFRDSLY
ncbi:MAG: hypothetical protein Q9209_006239 [Squamulea sp. 1 TL-2023]